MMLFLPLAVRSPRLLSTDVAGFLFENHWSWWMALAALAGVMMYIALLRANPRILRAGQAVLGVILLWIVAALLVDTPTERLYAAHVNLAAAVERGDTAAIFSYFDTTFSVPQLGLQGDELPAAKDQLAKILQEYGIKDTKIRAFHTSLSGDTAAVTHLTILTFSNVGAIPTTWQLSWNDHPDADWKIQFAKLLKIADRDFPMEGLLR